MKSKILKEYASQRKFSRSMMETLEELSFDDVVAVERLVSALQPSENTLRGILQLSTEVSARDKVVLSSLLNSTELVTIMTRSKVNRKDRQRAVREWLEGERYPLKQRISGELASLRRELVRESGFKIELPPQMEGDSLTVQMKISTTEECRSASEKLLALAESPSCQRVFDILQGEF